MYHLNVDFVLLAVDYSQNAISSSLPGLAES